MLLECSPTLDPDIHWMLFKKQVLPALCNSTNQGLTIVSFSLFPNGGVGSNKVLQVTNTF